MEYAAAEIEAAAFAPQPAGLSSDRDRWPEQAEVEYRSLLRELDRWCRKHDWPSTLNSWVAEEALRQCW